MTLYWQALGLSAVLVRVFVGGSSLVIVGVAAMEGLVGYAIR